MKIIYEGNGAERNVIASLDNGELHQLGTIKSLSLGDEKVFIFTAASGEKQTFDKLDELEQSIPNNSPPNDDGRHQQDNISEHHNDTPRTDNATITTDIISYYMSEACAYFALALNSVFNYSICMLVDYSQKDIWSDNGSELLPLIAHVFCIDSSNHAIDIKGIRSVADVKDDFFDLDEPTTEKLTPDELISRYMGDNKPLYGYNAQEVADAKSIILLNRERFSLT